jgi:RNA polymerase sigma-70 factor (ECF subfamily)
MDPKSGTTCPGRNCILDWSQLVAPPEPTCWTVIQAAAAGSGRERAEFARRYGPVVRAYLAARWRSSPCLQQLDDAVQDVFVECFKEGGVLQRADPGRGSGFRAFLCGVVGNVALRHERAQAGRREQAPASDGFLERVPDDDPGLSSVFERTWALALFREAGRLQEQKAHESGPAACRRVELLRLRFHEGLPIRDIARRWGAEAATLHHEYARARQEFRTALLEVVAFHHPGSPAEVEAECTSLLSSLG